MLRLSEENLRKILKILKLVESTVELQETTLLYRGQHIVRIEPSKIKEKIGNTKEFRRLVDMMNERVGDKKLLLRLVDKEIIERINQAESLVDPVTDIDLQTAQKNFLFFVSSLQEISKLKDYFRNGLDKTNQEEVSSKHIFHLSNDWNLSDDRGNSMLIPTGLKREILYELADKKGLLNTTDFAREKKKTTGYVSKQIQDLRNKVQDFFSIDNKDFIPDGLRGEGYRLGKNTKIIKKF